MDKQHICWAVIGAGVILVCLFLFRQRSGFIGFGDEMPSIGMDSVRLPKGVPVSSEYRPGFLPSHQGPWFEGMPPSLRVENDYHACILQSGGDYGNYELRQKCYIKTLKNGTYDRVDLMCWNYRHDEDQYYRCLDSIYGNLTWIDRFSGLKPCICPDGSSGSSTIDDQCSCPEYRPLNDRRMVNEYGDIIKKT